MYVSKFTDYSYRILIYLAQNENNLITIDEISKELGISLNHTKKIIWELGKKNIVTTTKGRRGGINVNLIL